MNLARLLRAIDVRAVSQRDGREAGALQAMAGTAELCWPQQLRTELSS